MFLYGYSIVYRKLTEGGKSEIISGLVKLI